MWAKRERTITRLFGNGGIALILVGISYRPQIEDKNLDVRSLV